MSNTYTQIHLQCVFAPRFRRALIQPPWQEEMHRYITALVQKETHKMLAVNSMPDHLHMFIGFRTTESIATLMERVKSNSSLWINKTGKVPGRFEWQEGYGAFSYEKVRCPDIIRYVHNQQEHHKRVKFLDEYRGLLEEFEVEYDERYIFREPE